MPAVFERPHPPGWVYPCTVEDLRDHLERFPEERLQGLKAVGLVPATRKDCHAHARYRFGKANVIHIYSHAVPLAYKLSPGTRRHHIEQHLCVELEFGMAIQRSGSRWLTSWEPECLRAYLLEHVLAHEIGHHVCHLQRRRAGLRSCPGRHCCEQFAEAYAVRHCRSRRAAAAGRGECSGDD